MKILLINVEDELPDQVYNYPPLGISYLSSYAQSQLPDLEFVIKTSKDPDIIDTDHYDMVGISSVSQFFNNALRIAEHYIARGIPTLIGGAHITLIPQSLPAGGIAVIGEGERTLVELINFYREKGEFEYSDLENIAGLAFRDSMGNLTMTPARAPINPLDTIPLPDREALIIPERGTVYMFTSRGCPFKCAFCASTRIYDNVRFFSADYVLNEIKTLIEQYNPLHIKFYDDLFIASKTRLRQIVEGIVKEGINKKVFFSLNATASMIDEETARLLRKMNVFTVGMGLESGNQEVLDYLKAGTASVDQNRAAVEILVRHGINPTATFIIGSPNEDRSRFNDTLSFIKNSKLSRSYLYLLTPYPGTPVWDYAAEKGLVSEDMDWSLLDINQNVDFRERIIVSEHLKPDDLAEMYREFDKVSKRKHFKRMPIMGIRRPDLIWPYLKLRFSRESHNG